MDFSVLTTSRLFPSDVFSYFKTFFRGRFSKTQVPPFSLTTKTSRISVVAVNPPPPLPRLFTPFDFSFSLFFEQAVFLKLSPSFYLFYP